MSFFSFFRAANFRFANFDTRSTLHFFRRASMCFSFLSPHFSRYLFLSFSLSFPSNHTRPIFMLVRDNDCGQSFFDFPYIFLPSYFRQGWRMASNKKRVLKTLSLCKDCSFRIFLFSLYSFFIFYFPRAGRPFIVLVLTVIGGVIV